MLQRELVPSEPVLWQGRPSLLAALLQPGRWLLPLLWTAGGCGWTVLACNLTSGPRSLAGAIRLEAGSVLPFVGAITILAGVMMIVSEGLSAFRTRRTLHAITDRRLLSIVEGARVKILAVPLRRINSVVIARSWSGRGTIRISATTVQDGRPLNSGSFHLRGVLDAEEAYRLLAQDGAMTVRF